MSRFSLFVFLILTASIQTVLGGEVKTGRTNDQEIIDNLELLSQMDMLENLDLFQKGLPAESQGEADEVTNEK